MTLARTVSLKDEFGVTRPKLLLVASTGGHLSQLVRLAERLQVSEESVWVTFNSPQSRSMLRDRDVLWVDYVAPRDLRGTVNAYRSIQSALSPHVFDGVLSTGAAVSLSGLYWAKHHGLPAVYVESVSRTHGPSLSGRLVERFSLAKTFTQHEQWASPRWPLVSSVLGDFSKVTDSSIQVPDTPRNIFVTLGTIKPYRFDRVVERLLEISVPGDRFVWQLGETTRSDLPGAVHTMMDADALLEASLAADVVVTHSGVGTILQMIDHGISPVVVPRRQEHREHVDNHQLQIWNLLTSSHLAHPVEVPDLTRDVLAEAAASHTVGASKE